jgi:hypothetical protein
VIGDLLHVRNDAVARPLIHLSRRREARNDLRGAHLQDLDLGDLSNRSSRWDNRLLVRRTSCARCLSVIARGGGRMEQRKVLHFDAPVAPTLRSSRILVLRVTPVSPSKP